MRERGQTFEPFARQHAYILVNEKLVDRMLKRLPERKRYELLDIAAGTGLMTNVAHLRARAIGAAINSVLLDIDLPALREARKEVPPGAVKGYVCASADCLPFTEVFDMAVFANSLHLLDDHAKVNSLTETRRVLHPGVDPASLRSEPSCAIDEKALLQDVYLTARLRIQLDWE